MNIKGLESHYQELERREQVEHQNVLLAIGSILKQKEGLQLFSYLFKSLEVATVPDIGMEGNSLHELLGHMRAGNSIYKLACEADFEITAKILAEIERIKYDNKLAEYRLNNDNNNNGTIE